MKTNTMHHFTIHFGPWISIDENHHSIRIEKNIFQLSQIQTINFIEQFEEKSNMNVPQSFLTNPGFDLSFCKPIEDSNEVEVSEEVEKKVNVCTEMKVIFHIDNEEVIVDLIKNADSDLKVGSMSYEYYNRFFIQMKHELSQYIK